MVLEKRFKFEIEKFHPDTLLSIYHTVRANPLNFYRTALMKFKTFLVTLCWQKAVLLLWRKFFSQKHLCQK